MTELQKIQDWTTYYKASPAGYQASALCAVLRNDGMKVLNGVLHALGLESSADLISDMEKRSK